MAAEHAKPPTRHVTLYGLHVTNEPLYQHYREGMMPILRRHGGAFGYDFAVSKVLKSEVEAPINRVFTIVFPTQHDNQRFFSDPAYLEVRSASFAQAVSSVTKIASYEEPMATHGG